MNQTDKSTIVAELTARLRSANTVYVTDFTGLNVKQVSDLRRRLRKAGVEYVVVKNTLARRALSAATVTGLDDHFKGCTALALGKEPSSAAKVLSDFHKEFRKPQMKGGVVDGRAVTPEQIKRLASLPPREVLLAKLAGGMQAPVATLAGLFAAPLRNLGYALQQVAEQKARNAA